MLSFSWFFDEWVVDFDLKIAFVVGLRDSFNFKKHVGVEAFVFKFNSWVYFFVVFMGKRCCG